MAEIFSLDREEDHTAELWRIPRKSRRSAMIDLR